MKTAKYTNYYVTCNGQEINVDDVEFLDIEEDFNGRDLMTFGYQGEVHKSYVRTYPRED